MSRAAEYQTIKSMMETHLGSQFAEHAIQLDEAFEPLRGGSFNREQSTSTLEKAFARYFGFFNAEGFKPLLKKPGVASECSHVMRHLVKFEKETEIGDPEFRQLWDLVVDLSALFTRVHLSAYDNDYYSRWKEHRGATRHGGKEVNDYDCLFGFDAPILWNCNLPHGLKEAILKLMGEVLSLFSGPTLLKEQLDELSRGDRRQPLSPQAFLSLQVLRDHRKTLKDLDAAGGDHDLEIMDAARFWMAQDPFLEYLMREWGWFEPDDFHSPLRQVDRDHLGRYGGDLYPDYVRSSPTGQLAELRLVPVQPNGTAAEGDELGEPVSSRPEEALPLPSERYALAPLSISLAGPPSVGKSSYLCSLVERALKKRDWPDFRINPDDQMFRVYDKIKPVWIEGKHDQTADFNNCGLWLDSFADTDHRIHISTKDFPGEDINPKRFRDEKNPFGKMIRESDGLVFLISADQFKAKSSPGGATDLEQLSAWFASILSWYRENNTRRRHIPIALVINKVDELLGDAFADLLSPELLNDDLKTELVHAGLPNHRLGDPSADDESRPSERLWRAVRDRVENNKNLKIQELYNTLFKRFDSFFSELLSTTYDYQIFLTVSRPPARVSPSEDESLNGYHIEENNNYPFGVLEANAWIIRKLAGRYAREAGAQVAAELERLGGIYEEIKKRKEELDDAVKALEQHSVNYRELVKACAEPVSAGVRRLGRFSEMLADNRVKSLIRRKKVVGQLISEAEKAIDTLLADIVEDLRIPEAIPASSPLDIRRLTKSLEDHIDFLDELQEDMGRIAEALPRG